MSLCSKYIVKHKGESYQTHSLRSPFTRRFPLRSNPRLSKGCPPGSDYPQQAVITRIKRSVGRTGKECQSVMMSYKPITPSILTQNDDHLTCFARLAR